MKRKFPSGLILFILLLVTVVIVEIFKAQLDYTMEFIRTFGILAAYGIMLLFSLVIVGIHALIDYLKNRRRK